ncbi:MAG: AraC family transcriptional regulator [Bacteroidales bacterium]|jgi:AraC-like DNA-binding protein|nr:AraC family transcriptional regulator [Bacteroidales bacterium]
MFTDNILLFINVACIGFLMVMLVTLAAATRMKRGAGWAAVIVVTTTVPVYLSNLARDLALDNYLMFWYPALFLNALCIPSLWFFTRSQLDKSFRITVRSILHAVPAFISLGALIAYYAPLTGAQIEADRAFMEAGGENLPAIINDILVFGQFFGYYTATFFYVRKRKKHLQDNFSDSDYMEIRWMLRFLTLFFALFFIVVAAYIIHPRTDVWLIPILNVVGMAYLVYCVVRHSAAGYIHRLPDAPDDTPKSENSAAPREMNGENPAMSADRMKEICDTVIQYLQTAEAYKNCDLSLAMLSMEIKIHSRNISTAINGYLHKNFFELVNGMRIEEAKRQLMELNTSNYSINSISAVCGFQSHTSFFRVFRKFEGTTPAQWLRNNLPADR